MRDTIVGTDLTIAVHEMLGRSMILNISNKSALNTEPDVDIAGKKYPAVEAVSKSKFKTHSMK